MMSFVFCILIFEREGSQAEPPEKHVAHCRLSWIYLACTLVFLSGLALIVNVMYQQMLQLMVPLTTVHMK